MASMLWTMTHACAHFNYGSSRPGAVESGACSRSSLAPPARPGRASSTVSPPPTAPSGPSPAPPGSIGRTTRRGLPRSPAWTPRTSPTTPTSRCPARRTPSARSPTRPPRPACPGLSCSRAAESRRPSAPSTRSPPRACRSTIVRCSWFAQNFSETFMGDGLQDGEVALPADDTPEPFVDAEDIADVAFAALTQDGHAGELYELTGPRALRIEEAVAEIAAASGRPDVHAHHPGGLQRGPAARAGGVRRLPVHGVARRPQRGAPGRRPSRPGPRPARLRRVRPPRGGRGGLGMSSTLENPVTGERFTFTEVTPERLAFDFALREGGKVPIPHVHATQTERFEVVSGTVRFRLGLRSVLAQPGDVVAVPPASPTRSPTPARAKPGCASRSRPRSGCTRCSPRSWSWRRPGG